MHQWIAGLVMIGHFVTVPAATSDTGGWAAAHRDSLQVDSATATPALDPRLLPDPLLVPADTTHASRRPKAVEYSDAYYTRLKIHQIGAIAMFPLFAAEYVMGQKLIASQPPSSNLVSAHDAVAITMGIVFASNTITGGWNWWDARHDPNGASRRTIHTVMMLVADIGFLATTASSPSQKNYSPSQAQTHRTIAIASISLTAVGAAYMWLTK